MLCVEKTYLYEVILSTIMNVLVFVCSEASKLGKIIARSAILVISELTVCRKLEFLLTYHNPNDLKLHISVSKSLSYGNLVLHNYQISCSKC